MTTAPTDIRAPLIPEGCEFSRCTMDCVCFFHEYQHWPEDELVALIERIGIRKPFQWAADAAMVADDMLATIRAIEKVTVIADSPMLRSNITAILDTLYNRRTPVGQTLAATCATPPASNDT